MTLYRMQLQAADALARSLTNTSQSVGSVRSSVSGPWESAVAEVGWSGASVPALLRSVGDGLDAGHRDLRWRVDFVRARYGDPSGTVTHVVVPERSPLLLRMGDQQLIDELAIARDPKRMQRLLAELIVRGNRNPATAEKAMASLGAEGFNSLLKRLIPDGMHAFDGDQVDHVIDLLRRLVGQALWANPESVELLLDGDHYWDVFRLVALLKDSHYPAAVYPAAIDWLFKKLNDPGLRRLGFSLLQKIPPIDGPPMEHRTPALEWFEPYSDPHQVAMDEIAKSAERSMAFLTAPGMLEWFVQQSTHNQRGDTQARKWELGLAAMIEMARRRLDELVASGAPRDVFDDAFAASLELLVALRDSIPAMNVVTDGELHRAVAALMTWHFTELAGLGWPLGETAGELARWLAESPDAIAILTAGVAALMANEFPALAASYAVGEHQSQRTAPYDRMSAVLEFLTMALLNAQAEPDQVLSHMKYVIDLVMVATIKVRVGALVSGAELSQRVLRTVIARLATDGYGRLAPQVPLGDVETIDDVLATLFFTMDGVNGSNDLGDVRPLQLLLFAELLRYHPEVFTEFPELNDFVVDGQVVPPEPGDAAYPDFIALFAKVRVSDTPAANSLRYLWHEITQWMVGDINIVERTGD